jgi:hypothetical protein
MRQPIKLVVRKGKIRLDGTSLIFLQYCQTAARYHGADRLPAKSSRGTFRFGHHARKYRRRSIRVVNYLAT